MLNRELEPVPYGFRVMPTAEAVPDARRRIVAAVREWRLGIIEDAMHDVALLSGEVIANAIEHTGAGCAVYVHWTGARVRVEVTDVDSGSVSLPADLAQQYVGLYAAGLPRASHAAPTGRRRADPSSAPCTPAPACWHPPCRGSGPVLPGSPPLPTAPDRDPARTAQGSGRGGGSPG